ncbi:hypothetical protein [Sinorhizobium medicae]|nr:hypothetical protein [Sinorhizobium medicae]
MRDITGIALLCSHSSIMTGMDKAGIAFMALLLVLISLVFSILAVDRTSIEARPNPEALVPTNYP